MGDSCVAWAVCGVTGVPYHLEPVPIERRGLRIEWVDQVSVASTYYRPSNLLDERN